MRTSRIATLTLALATTIGCAGPVPSGTPAKPTASATSPSPRPTAARTPVPTPTPVPTSYIAAGRAVLEAPSDAQLLVGRVEPRGAYDVLAVDLTGSIEPVRLGRIPEIEGRLPDGLELARDRGAAVSSTGFLIVTVGPPVPDPARSRLAVFDLAAPELEPWLVEGTQFRLVGDRLWILRSNELAHYDLPSRIARDVALPSDKAVSRDVVVPFFVTQAGDAVLVESQADPAAAYFLLDIDGAARPLPPLEHPLIPDRLGWTTAREQPFGPSRARIRTGPSCEAPVPDYCIELREAAQIPFHVDGFVDAAWAPGTESTAHIGSAGLGVGHRDGTTELIVRFDRRPVALEGFWSNVAIVRFDDGRLGGVFVGTDLLTQHPLPPDSILDLPGDVLLRALSWGGES